MVLHTISAILVRGNRRWCEADGKAREQQECILLMAWLLCRRPVWKIGKFSWQPTLRRSLLNVVVGQGFNSGLPPLFHSVSLVLCFLDAASPPREQYFFWSAAADAESGELQLGPGRLRACSTLKFRAPSLEVLAASSIALHHLGQSGKIWLFGPYLPVPFKVFLSYRPFALFDF